MNVSDVWKKLVELEKDPNCSIDLKGRVKHSIDELFNGRQESALELVKILESKKDKFISRFNAAMADKKFLKSLKESKTKEGLLKGVYSLGVHLCIESEKTGEDISGYLLLINEQVADLIADRGLKESFRNMFMD